MTIETVDTQPKPNLLNDPKFRAIAAQIVVVVLFVSFVAYIISNTAVNLEKLGIKAGFEFLGLQAGFMPTSPNFNLTDFDVNKDTHMDVFWLGLVNTLLIAVLGIIAATIVGFVFGVLRLSKNPLVNFVAAAYIEGVRNIPLLLQILVWYFGVLLALPIVKQSINMGDLVFLNNRYLVAPAPIFEDGFGFVTIAFIIGIVATFFLARWAHKRQDTTGQQFPIFYSALGLIIGFPILVLLAMGVPLNWNIPELKGFNFVGGVQITSQLTALFLALTFYTGSFIAENVRAGILAVSHGQTEAAYALGLRPNRTMSLIVIPQAMRVVVPPVTSQYLNLTKNSSLAIAIGYPDIVNVFMGISLNQTGKAIEIIGMTMGVYLTISLLISMFMNWYNKRVALVER
ncbi:MAG: amino acid ABC transporter permease [Alphaproteobacteria bacterium]|jgi:general L-amino acid transport system permease protein|nr:amino acid ABC transporter permease [Alphaproteobacteria bacterium]MBT4019397.1 amino acid ABC transporter permease [Alphaproteobacteria bacterium]MBT5160686.1 amino acid ABC transporter permease [Alphaproteobacteria bacterium]